MFHEKFGRNVRDNVWIIAMYFIAAIFLLVFVFPYLYMLFSSFKPSKDVISVDPTFFPKTWSMENYAKLFSTSGIPLNFTNSLIAALASRSGEIQQPAAYLGAQPEDDSDRVHRHSDLLHRSIIGRL